ncbi:subtype A tannase [Gordonia sp. C13]|uniref:subtype A tannase n=1 Tax=Gordonia sp. C13 TaxID=2935078 RepID=UPI002009E8C5|nr:subtype A tannase [Gordonia sp. C13]MCK8616720.1 carboxylesterase family protein [Gordonia sp. C13]
MEISRRTVLRGGLVAGVVGVFGVAACGTSSDSSSPSTTAKATAGPPPALTLNAATWSYDPTNDVYYQLGITYVEKPQATDYETLGVFVPGKYFAGTKNSDGTYTVKVNPDGRVGNLSATTAPIVFPVNTPGYAAQKPPTTYSYDDVSSYMKAGYVYVAAGLRGKDSQTTAYTGNAPWGVVDLKAAVRYVKVQGNALPGNKESVFVFGHSGGGAQSAVMGASGDSDLYAPYLETLGAAMADVDGNTVSDAVAGAMAWCPITSLDYANAAYEWNMGQFATTGTRAAGTWTAQYSQDLARAFADYQNRLALKDADGKALTLSETGDGIYLRGSYYDHIVSVVQTSLNDFLSYTTFPYTPNTQTMAGMGGAGASGGPPSGAAPSGAAPGGGTPPAGGATPGGNSSSTTATTYDTVDDYFDHLNEAGTWVRYDADTKKATVLNLKGFVTSQKNATKDVGAFDGISAQQTENVVMGKNTDGLHFAPVSRELIAKNQPAYAKLSDWKSEYGAAAYETDFVVKDSTGHDVEYRLNMYNPMYFLSNMYDGYKTSTVAPHWRIRTGIMQGDTASTVEVNLALALQNFGVDNVDFATVWGLGHTTAETTGDSVDNFINWVSENLS